MTATSVAPLSATSDRTKCSANCSGRPQWLVGPKARSCDLHLAVVLRAVRASSDGFAPVIPEPIGRAR